MLYANSASFSTFTSDPHVKPQKPEGLTFDTEIQDVAGFGVAVKDPGRTSAEKKRYSEACGSQPARKYSCPPNGHCNSYGKQGKAPRDENRKREPVAREKDPHRIV